MRRLTRRELVKGMAALGVAFTGTSVLAGCGATAVPESTPPSAATAEPAAAATSTPEVAVPTPATESGAEIRFGMWQGDPGLLDAVQKVMLADFQAKNPTYKVKLEMAGWSDYWDKLQVQIAGGTAPDVVWMSGAMFYDLMDRAAFTELTPYADRDEVNLDGYWSEPIYMQDGKLWAMHFYAMVHALYYNRTMFEAAGIAEPPTDWDSPEWTWADFREAAKALSTPEGDSQQWGVELYNGAEWGFGTFILSNGASALNEDKTEATTDSAEFIEAMQLIADMIHEDHSSPTPGEPAATLSAGLVDLFQAGRAAMRTGNNSRLPTYLSATDVDWAPCVPPRATADKPRQVYWLENPFCMTSSCKTPDAAWLLLRYIGLEDGQQALAVGKIGMPALKSKALDPAGDFLKPPPDNLKVFPDALEGGHTTDLQFTRQWLRWQTVLSQELDPLYLGEKSAEECCRNAKREIDKVLPES